MQQQIESGLNLLIFSYLVLFVINVIISTCNTSYYSLPKRIERRYKKLFNPKLKPFKKSCSPKMSALCALYTTLPKSERLIIKADHELRLKKLDSSSLGNITSLFTIAITLFGVIIKTFFINASTNALIDYPIIMQIIATLGIVTLIFINTRVFSELRRSDYRQHLLAIKLVDESIGILDITEKESKLLNTKSQK